MITYAIEGAAILYTLNVVYHLTVGLVKLWQNTLREGCKPQEHASTHEVVESIIEQKERVDEAYTVITEYHNEPLTIKGVNDAFTINCPVLQKFVRSGIYERQMDAGVMEWDEPAQQYGRSRVYRKFVQRQAHNAT